MTISEAYELKRSRLDDLCRNPKTPQKVIDAALSEFGDVLDQKGVRGMDGEYFEPERSSQREPIVPSELWMFWLNNGGSDEKGGWLRSANGSLIVADSWPEADECARAMCIVPDQHCKAVRVK